MPRRATTEAECIRFLEANDCKLVGEFKGAESRIHVECVCGKDFWNTLRTLRVREKKGWHICKDCHGGAGMTKTLARKAAQQNPPYELVAGQIYTGMNRFMRFRCPVHGVFTTTPEMALNGNIWCKECHPDAEIR